MSQSAADIYLSYHIPRSGFVLDVETRIPGSGITAVLGASGSGKTSLLRAIAGLDRVAEGHCVVAGEVWQAGRRGQPPHRRPVGYVFQQPSLFPHLSARQNIVYAQRRAWSSARIDIDAVIELLAIAPLLDQYPATLSGGEQQRVAIARALAVQPTLLLLDEPLTALDDGRKQEVLPYLESLHQSLQLPMLYVTHSRTEAARLADTVILLDAGKIVAQGNITELFARVDTPLAQAADAGVIIEAIVHAHDSHYQLTTLQFPGGACQLSRMNAPLGSQQRLQIYASDVSIALSAQPQNSILNTFPGVIQAMQTEGQGQVLCQIQLKADTGKAASTVLLSRITQKSADRLALSAGVPVLAQVKSVALIR